MLLNELTLDCQLVGAECLMCEADTHEITSNKDIYDFIKAHKGHTGVSLYLLPCKQGMFNGHLMKMSFA